MHLLVGLGNPGNLYSNSRHNLGFLFLEFFAKLHGLSVSQSKFKSLHGRSRIFKEDVVFLMPQTFMNLSGAAVLEAVNFYKLQPSDVTVVFDDLDQAPGAVRMRVGGGHGGHNGIRNMMDKLGFDGFHRIKVGIGKPQFVGATASYVLENFSESELNVLYSDSFPVVIQRFEDILKNLLAKKHKS